MEKTQLLFLSGCIPARILMTIFADKLGYILFAIAFGFLYLYFTNSRLNAQEATGGVTWWHPLRIIHGLLYLIGGILALSKYSEYAWIPLAIDTILGLSVFCTKLRNANNVPEPHLI